MKDWTVSSSVYEWNYQKQLLAIKIQEGTAQTVEEKERHIFSRDFLLERPLLKSILAQDASPVLLIDEIDRADEAFEAFLSGTALRLSDHVPEMGTIRARHIPYVILTSNRTRELSDALKRRCLYHWIDYPSFEKEMRIVRARLPGIEEELGSQVVRLFRRCAVGSGEAAWSGRDAGLRAGCGSLGSQQAEAKVIEETMGCLAKSMEDGASSRTQGSTFCSLRSLE